MAGHGIPLAFCHSTKDHRHGLVGTALFWIEAEPPGDAMVVSVILPGRRGDVEQRCRGLTPAAGAVRFTPANPPRRGSSRNSIRSRHSAKPVRPISTASST